MKQIQILLFFQIVVLVIAGKVRAENVSDQRTLEFLLDKLAINNPKEPRPIIIFMEGAPANPFANDQPSMQKFLQKFRSATTQSERLNWLHRLRYRYDLGPWKRVVLKLLIANLKNEDKEIRKTAIEVLGVLPSGRERAGSVLVLMDLFEQGDSPAAIAKAFIKAGPAIRAVQPRLTALLRHKNRDIRLAVLKSLKSIDPVPETMLPELIHALKDKNALMGESRAIAVELLGRIGPRAMAAIPALLDEIENTWSGLPALAALGEIGSSDGDVVPLLIEAMEESAADSAAVSLGKIAQPPRGILGAFYRALGQRDSQMRLAAVKGLAEMGLFAEAAAPRMAQELDNSFVDSKIRALDALGNLSEAAAPFAPAIAQSLRNKNRRIRDAATRTLRRLGPASQKAIPVFRQLLQEDDPEIRMVAVQLVGFLGPVAKALSPSLKKLALTLRPRKAKRPRNSKKKDPPSELEIRTTAQWALYRVTGQPATSLAMLLKELKKSRGTHGEAAVIYAIGRLGSEAEPATSILERIKRSCLTPGVQRNSNTNTRLLKRAIEKTLINIRGLNRPFIAKVKSTPFPKNIDATIALLDSNHFEERTKAKAILANLGEAALKNLLAAREHPKSLEMQSGLDILLLKILRHWMSEYQSLTQVRTPWSDRRYRAWARKYDRLPLYTKELFQRETQKAWGWTFPSNALDDPRIASCFKMNPVDETTIQLNKNGSGSYQRIIHLAVWKQILIKNFKRVRAENRWGHQANYADAQDLRMIQLIFKEWIEDLQPSDTRLIENFNFENISETSRSLRMSFSFKSLPKLARFLWTTQERFKPLLHLGYDKHGVRYFSRSRETVNDKEGRDWSFAYLDGMRERVTLTSAIPIRRHTGRDVDGKIVWEGNIKSFLSDLSVVVEFGDPMLKPQSKKRTDLKQIPPLELIKKEKPEGLMQYRPCSPESYAVLQLTFSDPEDRRNATWYLARQAASESTHQNQNIRYGLSSDLADTLLTALKFDENFAVVLESHRTLKTYFNAHIPYWDVVAWQKLIDRNRIKTTRLSKATVERMRATCERQIETIRRHEKLDEAENAYEGFEDEDEEEEEE